ncbi:MAG: hypothetical protein JWP89_5158 [Schlesneria sp.]|nr:hypothetical protein [Schlesneria sp.]
MRVLYCLVAAWVSVSAAILLTHLLAGERIESAAIEVAPKVIDLGVVYVGDRAAKCIVEVRNVGTYDLVIEPTSSCGCVVLDGKAHVLRPRERVRISLEVAVPEAAQRIHRSIQLNYRAIPRSEIRRLLDVDIIGDVRP